MLDLWLVATSANLDCKYYRELKCKICMRHQMSFSPLVHFNYLMNCIFRLRTSKLQFWSPIQMSFDELRTNRPPRRFLWAINKSCCFPFWRLDTDSHWYSKTAPVPQECCQKLLSYIQRCHFPGTQWNQWLHPAATPHGHFKVEKKQRIWHFLRVRPTREP